MAGKVKYPIVDGKKRCSQCREEKTIDSFSAQKRGGNGLNSKCKKCVKENQDKWRADHPDYDKNANIRLKPLRTRRYLWDRYKLTTEQYEKILAYQGNRCAICWTEFPHKNGTRWNVDHDHSCCPGQITCGECVRGLLCHNCNILIAHAKDSPEILKGAIKYLQKSTLVDSDRMIS